MANAYGRGGAATAQRGKKSSAYDFRARDAEDYLSGNDLTEYRSALGVLGKAPAASSTGNVLVTARETAGQKQAIDRVQRLRDVAASRAFEQFQSNAVQQYAKPWLRNASQGLITPETTAHSLAELTSFGGERDPYVLGELMRREDIAGEHEFEALGLSRGEEVNKQIGAAVGGNYDPEFFGDPNLRRNAKRRQLFGSSKLDFGTAITPGNFNEAEGLYSGVGGRGF